ncbi:zinc metalloprotease HtpX [Pectinatus cerevisiiphilus]|uniref:Protease HtpX homolog n=1 Tax=Pectinatus cerevisiiphilus TaxID=86956 RepID=A0A4V2US83_9FIRM|nr:zinc metalloprotease HtpX [Pectinatus cerevisiiphilus]TCS80412.1 heat shock protein HtpX [Pectinatus cerevisiiphilus]
MNMLKTTALMALLMALLIAVGGLVGGQHGALLMFIVALAMNFFSYWFSDSIVLKMSGARQVNEEDAPSLYKLVADLAQRADLPMPKVYIIDTDVPNAFATGRNPSHAAVAVTTGIMGTLEYEELAGVLGHELTHVKNRDILISSIAATFAAAISMLANMAQWAAIFGGGRSNDENDRGGGIIGLLVAIIIAPLAASIIQMAISRSREYAADKGGGQICGDPLALASALEKIEYYAKHKTMPQASQATEHMYIINPLAGKNISFASLFSTHPATADRIARLKEQAAQMR